MTIKPYLKDGTWNTVQLNRFCRYLLAHGWTDLHGRKFRKGDLTIEADNRGMFVWEGRARTRGLAAEAIHFCMQDQSPLLGPFFLDRAHIDLYTGKFVNAKPPKKVYGAYPAEEAARFLAGLGTHAPQLAHDNTTADWLEKHIAANTLPNLVYQPWRKQNVVAARKLLAQEA